ncbi:unnamed protein product [Arabis nemorensis]|uniref:Uncharacterized protein n=1 Tax=Arabis nemorensis TaxID=586526 RepID=A0A565AU85_9BRAS|nr:unnamed protein product [Arabis nemorensis]
MSHRNLLDVLEICGVPPEKFRTIGSSIDKQHLIKWKRRVFVKETGQPIELLSKLRQEGSKLSLKPSAKGAEVGSTGAGKRYDKLIRKDESQILASKFLNSIKRNKVRLGCT